MKSDSEIALDRVQSESLGALISIQSYRDIGPAYFDRLRDAVSDAVSFFSKEELAPAALLDELKDAAQVLRNEAVVFTGRFQACDEMAEWLDAQRVRLMER